MTTTVIDEPVEPVEPVESEAVAPRQRTILGPPRLVGTVGAFVFLWASFWPTLMPRTPFAQGAISGLCVAMGYAVFTFLGWAVRPLVRRLPVTSTSVTNRVVTVAVAALGGFVVVVGGLWMWLRWQNDQRALLGMVELHALWSIPMLLIAALVAVIVALVGRTIGRGVAAINRLAGRWLSPGTAIVVTVVAVTLISSFLLTDVAASRFSNWANSAFGTIDEGTADGIEQPTRSESSGSPESLAAWDTLGFQGRTFVATATPVDTIAAFHDAQGGREIGEPVRVYVGIDTASDIEERAALAVDELDRTGAFEREVLAVVTVTGTGWVDPDAAAALEVLHGGDTAMVAMQYSFLPSWIATLIDRPAASEAGAVLFDAVYDRWSTLPDDQRPKLVVFGLSLGSYGAEAAFAGATASNSIRNLTARADGALLGGPTNDNPVWQQVTAERDEGSPVWRPVYDEGRTVRFANDADQLVDIDESWPAPRIVYVQHASDPVTFWSPDSLWRPPDWMDAPRGPDVPEGGPWFPLVTGTQGVFDLMAGFGAPPGHGHDYRLAWPGAWAQVAPPDAWSADDTRALQSFLVEQHESAAAD